jgi:hypothetical protein
MKKVVFIVALLLMATNSASGHNYVGIYADIDHLVCDVMNPSGTLLPFEFWIWWLPDSTWVEGGGMHGANFSISYPASVIRGTVTANPLIISQLGDLDAAQIEIRFSECQTGWIWTHHRACYLTTNTPGIIDIRAEEPTGNPPDYLIVACVVGGGDMCLPVTRLTPLYLNRDIIATEDITWGAIKALYR